MPENLPLKFSGATIEPGEPPSDGAPTVWFTWTAPHSGVYRWTHADPVARARIRFYQGRSLPGLIPVGDGTGEALLTAVEGVVYQIRLSTSFAADAGRLYINDNRAPSVPVPEILQSGPEGTRMAFRWSQPSGVPVDHYRISANGALLSESTTGTLFVHSGFLPARSYRLRVTAVAAGGFESLPGELDFTTLPPPQARSFRIPTLLVKYADYPDAPFDASYVQQLMYGENNSVDTYFREVSRGRSGITGEVYGWITLPQPAAFYHTRPLSDGLYWGPDFTLIHNAIQTIINSGTSGLPADLYSGSDKVCHILHGTGDAGWSGIYLSSRLGDSIREAALHEIGHNPAFDHAALGHPGGWICPGDLTGPGLLNSRQGNCESWIYGYEPFDPMGSGTRPFMSYHQWLMGWLDASEIATDTPASSVHEYDLTALASADPGTRMVTIPVNDDFFYFAEYRSPVGLDGRDLYPTAPNDPPIDGVLVRLRCGRTAPGAPYFPTLLPYGQNRQPYVMDPAHPFSDPVRGIRVEMVSKAGGAARIRIVRTPPARVAPPAIAWGGNSPQLTWAASEGATYCVERTWNLGQSWEEIAFGLTPGSGLTSITVSPFVSPLSSRAFFRVRRL